MYLDLESDDHVAIKVYILKLIPSNIKWTDIISHENIDYVMLLAKQNFCQFILSS